MSITGLVITEQLQDRARYQQAARDLDALNRVDRDVFVGQAHAPEEWQKQPANPDLLERLALAYKRIMTRRLHGQ